VAASVLGLIVGTGAINVFAPGVLMKPIAAELKLGRGVISSAIGLASIVTGILSPFVGRLIDRWGVRPVLLPAIALFAVSTASLSLLNSSVFMLLALFALQGVLGTGQTPTGYSKIISTRFDYQRGLALGIALAGVGLGTAVIPQVARILLQRFGWRMTYIGLGCAIFVLAFVPVAVVFGETAEEKVAREQATTRAGVPGMNFSEAVRTPKYWAITIAFFLGFAAVNGSLIHLVPLLTDRGLPITAATTALSISGLALIGGRLVAGYLLDRVFASYITIFFLVCPMIGVALLASGWVGLWPVVGTVFLGLGVGGEVDLMAFMTGRYFGVRAFGALHGLMFTFAVFANAAGSSLMGWCFQFRHTYTPVFILFEVFLVIAIMLIARLGPYKYPVMRRGGAPKTEAAVTR
jgi:MFS family permease